MISRNPIRLGQIEDFEEPENVKYDLFQLGSSIGISTTSGYENITQFTEVSGDDVIKQLTPGEFTVMEGGLYQVQVTGTANHPDNQSQALRLEINNDRILQYNLRNTLFPYPINMTSPVMPLDESSTIHISVYNNMNEDLILQQTRVSFVKLR